MENKKFHVEIQNNQTVAWLVEEGIINPVIYYLYSKKAATRNGLVTQHIFSQTPPDQLPPTEAFITKQAQVDPSQVVFRGGDFHVDIVRDKK